MPSKTPHNNGKNPAGSGGTRKNQDLKSNKGKKTPKDGDDEMTVVVPLLKGKVEEKGPADADGDVDMGAGNDAGDAKVKVDPVVQTIAGKSFFAPVDFGCWDHLDR